MIIQVFRLYFQSNVNFQMQILKITKKYDELMEVLCM